MVQSTLVPVDLCLGRGTCIGHGNIIGAWTGIADRGILRCSFV